MGAVAARPAFQKAVEEDAAHGYGVEGLMPSKGLTRNERIIEAHFAHQIFADPEKALRNYIALSIADFGPEAEGRYLNADLARDVYPPCRDNLDMRAGLERATVAPAGFIALNLTWKHWLKNTDPAKRGSVVFMAGGMASGKTTSVKMAFDPSEKAQTALFVDSTLQNEARAEQMIQSVEAAGLYPVMVFVYRPFESASRAAIKTVHRPERRPPGEAGAAGGRA